MRKIYSCVDIGSNSIKIIVCEYLDKKYNVLSSTIQETTSVRKGVVCDEQLFIDELHKALKNINNSLGIKIDKVILNVPIYDAKYTLVDGYTTITGEDNIITGEDMVNALQASIYNKIDKSEELVTIMPIKYILNDDEKIVIKEPRGLQADKLKVFAIMITVPKKNIYKVVSSVEKLGIEIVDILFGSIGDYTLFKDEVYDTSTVGVINFGTDKIELSIFNNGIITNSTIIQYGTRNIDNYISYVYNIKKSQAKRIKEIFALADTEYASQSEVYEINNRSSIKTKISQYEVSQIISNRIKEILQNSKKELNHLTKKEISYIIITGGISNIPGFESVAKEVFGDTYKKSEIDIVGIRNNSYSSCMGMIVYFLNKLKIRGKSYSMFDEDKEVELIDTKKNDNIFGKVFDYLIKSKED